MLLICFCLVLLVFLWNHTQGTIIHRVSKKLCQRYFVNNSVKHWPNLIIFGTQHRKETWHKRLSFAHLTLILLTCYTTLWNAEVVVWTFTTMNSCCVPHAGSENHCKTRKSLKYVTSLTLIKSKFIIPRSRTSANWNDASTASGLLWVTRLLNVIMLSGISVYALAFVLERIFWARTVIKVMWCDMCDFFEIQ